MSHAGLLPEANNHEQVPSPSISPISPVCSLKKSSKVGWCSAKPLMILGVTLCTSILVLQNPRHWPTQGYKQLQCICAQPIQMLHSRTWIPWNGKEHTSTKTRQTWKALDLWVARSHKQMPSRSDKIWRARPHWCPATQAAKWLPKLMTWACHIVVTTRESCWGCEAGASSWSLTFLFIQACFCQSARVSHVTHD